MLSFNAMQIATDNTPVSTGLDPNTESIAKIVGWMMGSGFLDFYVIGDGPFGLKFTEPDGTINRAEPGDIIVKVKANGGV